jgi:hypothetical protein
VTGAESVSVEATWTPDGWPVPSQIVWRGEPLAVLDVGRRWKTDDGLHLLARVVDGRVFELHTNGARWWARVVSPPQERA